MYIDVSVGYNNNNTNRYMVGAENGGKYNLVTIMVLCILSRDLG